MDKAVARDPDTLCQIVDSHPTSATAWLPETHKISMVPATELNSLEPAKTPPNFENLLSNELWTMILEHVIPENPVLLVSRRLNNLFIPIRYRHMTLGSKLLNSPDPITIQIARYFRKHTRHIYIHEELDWDLTIERLSECKAFQDLTWTFFPEIPYSLPARIHKALLRPDWVLVRLHIKLYSRLSSEQAPSSRSVLIESIPVKNLVSLAAFDEEIPGSNIGSLLVSAKRLETLCLLGGQIILPQDDKVSPLIDLWLQYAAYDLTSIWNFSRLRILTLETDFQQFPTCLSANTFPALRELSIFSRHPPENRRLFSRRFAAFIRDLNSLEELLIPVYSDLETILKAIAKHKSLKALSIIESAPLTATSLTADRWQYKLIQQSCAGLTRLRINAVILVEDILSPSTELLASFRNLRELTIQIQSERSKSLWVKGFHTTLKDSLRAHKFGVPISKIDIGVCSDSSLPIARDRRFSGNISYEYSQDGTETVRESTWPRI